MARTKKTTALRGKPSSSSQTIEMVPMETYLSVIERSKDGGWVKVLFGNHEGWLAARHLEVIANEPSSKSAVEAEEKNLDTDDKAKTEAPAKRGVRPEVWVEDSKYHAGAGPGAVEVTARLADLLDRPKEGAQKVGVARAGDRLASSRTSRDGAWFLVELADGRTAWIAAASVTAAKVSPAAPRTTPLPAPTAPVEVVTAAPADPEKAARAAARDVEALAYAQAMVRRRVHVRAAAGFALSQIDQRFTSNATGALTNYTDHSGLVGVDLGLALDVGFQGGWFGGVSTAYRFGGAADVTAHTQAQGGDRAVTLGIRSHDLEALGLFGYRSALLGGLTVSALAGMRLQLNLVDQDYAVPIPSERLLGFQVGLGLDIPRLVGSLGVAIGIAWMPIGTRDQTLHLGEGTDVGTSGYTAMLGLSYALTNAWAIVATGRYTHAATRFDGAAARNPSITTADRATTLAGISLGLRFTQ